jgi:hypothetical protein
LVSALDELASEDVTGRSLADELLTLDRARARLDAEVARRLRAFDRSLEWATSGARSAAAFLITHTRCASGEAHHRVRVARELDALDDTAAAWAEGAITTRHVSTIASARHAAKANEQFDEFEPALVDLARAGTPEDVAGLARQWRDALDADLDRDGSARKSAAERQQDRRGFDFSRSIDGMGFGSLTLDPVDAEFVESALHAAYDALHRADDPRTPSQQRADAFVEICRRYAEARSRSTNLPSVLVIADEATLRGETVGECRLASGHRISPATARRIMCEAQIQSLHLDDAGVPLAMGRATRLFTPHQARAMVVRDHHCRGPGCRVEAAFCQTHHLDEWERDDGPTDLENGALFWRGYCHRMLHEGGWTVTGDANGRLEFRDRQGGFIGASTPYEPADPILTKRGRARRRLDRRIHARVHALKHSRRSS